ncbi:hypothetical protein ACU635_50490 [[Actinomadura] parvosata]|uniref:hypothetical protein n=1 Tax=[Actinomadura] parvosata TaxID=1955412 RepID=UPI00406CA321
MTRQPDDHIDVSGRYRHRSDLPGYDTTATGYNPDWIHQLMTVTPDDIHRVYEQARAAGCDPADLDDWLQQAIKGAGGTIEGMAKAWTMKNRRARLRAHLERTKHRRVGKS